jgi:predicted flap endonuclease-1-like 5' DNA nuclease
MFEEWGFLLGEIWVLLLLAALLGLFVGWLIWGRVSSAFAAREAELQRKVKQRDDRIVALERDVKRLNEAAAAHDEVLKARDTRIAAFDDDMNGLRAISDGHASAVKDRDARIAELEAQLADARATASGQDDIVQARDAALAENEKLLGKVQSLQQKDGELMQLRSDLSAAKSQIAGLEGQASSDSDLAAQLDACKTRGEQKDARIAELEAALAARSETPAATSIPDYDGDGVQEGLNEGTKPETLTAARFGGPDDLKRIKGVGPKLEQMLHGLGFFHFDQVAAWTEDEVAWVDANLEGFNGRVSRDAWVAQAKLLASGGETEFSRRVDEGDVYE